MSEYLSKLFGLEGKVAAVTGAGGHLCSEMAKALARAGIKVALLDTNTENIKKVADTINSEGGDACPFLLDVTDIRRVMRVLPCEG